MGNGREEWEPVNDLTGIGEPEDIAHLPHAMHHADWETFCRVYGFSFIRRALLQGLQNMITLLKHCGCRRVLVGGSFVTEKDFPGDFDGCWDVDGVNIDELAEADMELVNRMVGVGAT